MILVLSFGTIGVILWILSEYFKDSRSKKIGKAISIICGALSVFLLFLAPLLLQKGSSTKSEQMGGVEQDSKVISPRKREPRVLLQPSKPEDEEAVFAVTYCFDKTGIPDFFEISSPLVNRYLNSMTAIDMIGKRNPKFKKMFAERNFDRIWEFSLQLLEWEEIILLTKYYGWSWKPKCFKSPAIQSYSGYSVVDSTVLQVEDLPSELITKNLLFSDTEVIFPGLERIVLPPNTVFIYQRTDLGSRIILRNRFCIFSIENARSVIGITAGYISRYLPGGQDDYCHTVHIVTLKASFISTTENISEYVNWAEGLFSAFKEYSDEEINKDAEKDFIFRRVRGISK